MRRVDAGGGTLEDAAACDPPLDLGATCALVPRDVRCGVIVRCVVMAGDAAFSDGGIAEASGPAPAWGVTSGTGSGFSATGVGSGAVGSGPVSSGAEGESGEAGCAGKLCAWGPGTAPLRWNATPKATHSDSAPTAAASWKIAALDAGDGDASGSDAAGCDDAGSGDAGPNQEVIGAKGRCRVSSGAISVLSIGVPCSSASSHFTASGASASMTGADAMGKPSGARCGSAVGSSNSPFNAGEASVSAASAVPMACAASISSAAPMAIAAPIWGAGGTKFSTTPISCAGLYSSQATVAFSRNRLLISDIWRGFNRGSESCRKLRKVHSR